MWFWSWYSFFSWFIYFYFIKLSFPELCPHRAEEGVRSSETESRVYICLWGTRLMLWIESIPSIRTSSVLNCSSISPAPEVAVLCRRPMLFPMLFQNLVGLHCTENYFYSLAMILLPLLSSFTLTLLPIDKNSLPDTLIHTICNTWVQLPRYLKILLRISRNVKFLGNEQITVAWPTNTAQSFIS